MLTDKYRPKNLDEIVGQGPIMRVIKSSIARKRLPSSYLFTGKKGTGKTSTARILAKMVNCSTENYVPCDSCESCLGIKKGQNSDIVEIDAASHRGVESVERLIQECHFLPLYGRKKVIIFDEVQQLSNTAFDALLKILEEPPSHVLFILCTTDPEQIPDTIVSRCLRLHFKRPNIQEIVDYLSNICKREKIIYEDKALAVIAEHSDNSFRDALIALESIGEDITIATVSEIYSIVSIDTITIFVYNLIQKKEKSSLRILNKYIQEGGDSKSLIDESLKFLRLMNIFDIDPNNEIPLEISNEKFAKYAKLLTNKVQLEGKNQNIKEILLMLSSLNFKTRDIDQLLTEMAIIEHCKEKIVA